MPQTAEAQFYELYFQEPGVAEAEFEKDPRLTMRAMLYGGSGEGVAAIRAVAASSGRAPSVGMVKQVVRRLARLVSLSWMRPALPRPLRHQQPALPQVPWIELSIAV
jgi:hypothetical protein